MTPRTLPAAADDDEACVGYLKVNPTSCEASDDATSRIVPILGMECIK